MASDTAVGASFLERVGDTFSNLIGGVVGFVSRMIGTSNEGLIKSLGLVRTKDPEKPYHVIPGSLLAKINELEPQMQALSDSELKGFTPQFKQRLAKGETLDSLLPEAFAACREAARRTKSMRHYDVQMIGGIVLHRGNISEMVTGEGKTLVATLPAYLNCLTGHGVHVVTVNDYLARRDCEWMLPIYSALGVSAGFIQSDIDPVARRKAYECDITYGTSSEFGFDYLRDNMKPARFGDDKYHPYYQQVQRELNFAIIDEVDNILIDEARTPLIISGPAYSDITRYEKTNAIAVQLTELEKKAVAERDALIAQGLYQEEEDDDNKSKKGDKKLKGIYYEIKEKERTVQLTDKGIRKAEELAGVESFYTAGNMEWPHLIDNSLKAHHLYQKDKHYMVMDHEGERKIIIIDEFTGRALFGRQWSDGLHQAVEAKHRKDGVQIKQETQTLATITLQHFFMLYKKRAGMTGTAMTEAGEFWKIYKLDVVAIPTNKPLRRVNEPDLVFRTQKEKWNAIVEEIVEKTRSGRPILIGTTDVAKSEKLADMLRRRGIKHELLNAKPENVSREADIVAQAGRKGAVTIATNMAGRGTDIILGGNPETMAWAQLKDKYPTRLDVPEDVWKNTVDAIEAKEKTKEAGREIAALGGLHIIGTERHESRRIDNQLRGRSGRQGDPGSSRYYVAMEDDLMRLFMGEWVSSLLGRLGMEEGQAIESRMVSKRIEGAQRKVEEYHFEQRKSLLDYDEVMNAQRTRIYGKRQEILNDSNCKAELIGMIEKQVESAVERFLDAQYGMESFAEFASSRFGVEYEIDDFGYSDFAEAERIARDKAIRDIPDFIQGAMDENLSTDEDPKDWKWQEMARVVSTKYGLKYNDRQMKQIGRDNLAGDILTQATKAVEQVDLSEGKKYLEPTFGLESLIDWVKAKFAVEMELKDLQGKEGEKVREFILDRIHQAYRQKEIEFPVQVAMASFMADKAQPTGGQKYDREGLFRWAKTRFGVHAQNLVEEQFRTESRSRLREMLMEISKTAFPPADQTKIDEQLEETFSGTKTAEEEDAKELAEWFKTTYQIDLPVSELQGSTKEEAQKKLWNAFDYRYRPEMRRMERNLLLDQLDSTWKQHLLTMDHLRDSIRLYGVAQAGDPRMIYKKEGMKEFETMWEGLSDRVTDSIFRMEDQGEDAFQEALWAGAQASHDQAQSIASAIASKPQQQDQTSTNQGGEKKIEPIRNRAEKVGRNDPCPCGSGKKYKNCHMRINSAK
jgi:preprotein translocase subunit SecA